MSNGHGSKKRPGSIATGASPPAPPFLNGTRMPGQPVHIPTLDGKLQYTAVPEGGARVSLQVLEAEGSDSALQHHIGCVYYDDSLLGRRTAAKLSPLARPKSLAVPWLTTQAASPELLRPVMSISPQGTYLSKIIPNAIMPPTVDVIALSSNRVRTLSRCSLATVSPASVRSVGRFPSLPGSRGHSSSSDNWSHSQSTETIVSNTSTISSQGGSRRSEAGPSSQAHGTLKPARDQLSSGSSSCAPGRAAPASPSLLEVRSPGSSGRASPAYSTSSLADGSDSMSVRSDRSSVRSVSLRKMKQAPPPPRRTYSLHQKAQQLQAEGAPRAMGLPPKPERRPPRESSEAWAQVPPGSPGLPGEDEVFSHATPSETSSLCLDSAASIASAAQGRPLTLDQLSSGRPQELSSKQGSPAHSGRTLSPSSGYSSQSGTPTLHARDRVGQAVSPGRKRPQPRKPERGSSLQSPGLSGSSSLTSLSSSASDPAPAEGLGLPATGAPSLDASGAGALLIPPHPKVPAPFSPPPTKPQRAEPPPAEAAVALMPAAAQAHPQPPTLPKASSGSPPPSPPPAYHPPPPPAKKLDVNPETPPSLASEPDAPADSLWPPPPPPPPEEQDLSMADFPPPEEACISAPRVLEPQLPAAAGPPPTQAMGAPSAPEQPPHPRAAPAAEVCGPPSPSKVQQQGSLGGPRGELPLPASLADGQGSHASPRRAAAPAALLLSGLPAAAGLKKPVASGPRPDQRKELATRSKSCVVPKEDASLPIVTPSLLQMVRLRSVRLGSPGPVLSPAAATPPAEQNGPGPAGSDRQGQPAPRSPSAGHCPCGCPPQPPQGQGGCLQTPCTRPCA